jgi:putative FmdB family regulatory protein
MPFYEYECSKCGYHDEVLQNISEKPLQKCPSCGKSGLKKLMSAPVFRLKGSGWYETDFKSDKENKRNLAAAEKEEAKTEAKADAKADAKSEAKADAKTDGKADGKADAKPETKVEKSSAAKPAPVKTVARSKPRSKPAPKARRVARR